METDNRIKNLIKELGNRNSHNRETAFNELIKTGSSHTVQLLINSLKDNDMIVRQYAIRALGKIGDPGAVKPLIDAMKNSFLCVSAIVSLGEIGDPLAVQPLICALKDKDDSVRSNAAKALGQIGDLASLQPLITALKDDTNIFVRKNAAEALGMLGDPNALKALNISASRDTYFVSSGAAHAIDNIMNSNRQWKICYPHLLCSKCFMKTVKKQIIRYGILKIHTVAVCRSCNSWIHLVKNARKIIGVIGGKEDFYATDGNAYVSLWSEQKKKARNADIDVLEIWESEGISYDYAINAVLMTLKNDASRPGKYVKELPVAIHGNPRIPEGARIVLEHEFGKIETRR